MRGNGRSTSQTDSAGRIANWLSSTLRSLRNLPKTNPCAALGYLSILSIGVLPFRLARIPVGPFSVPVAVMALALFGICTASAIVFGRIEYKRLPRWSWALLGLAISIALPLVFGRRPTPVVLEMLVYLPVPVVLGLAAGQRQFVRTALNLLGLIAFIWSAWALLLYFSGQSAATLPIASTVGDRNSLSFMLVGIYFLLLGVATSRTVDRRWSRWVSVLVSGIILAAITLSFSRGAWAGTLVGLLLASIRVRSKRVLLVAASVLVGAVVLIAGAGLSDRTIPGTFELLARRAVGAPNLLVNPESASPGDAHRWEALARSWAAIVRDPLVGIGVGNFERDIPIPSGDGVLAHPHNAYIHIWVEQGAIGLISFLVLIAAPLLAMHRRARRSAMGEDLSIGLTASLVSLATIMLMESFHNFLFFWVFYGLLLATFTSDGTAHSKANGSVRDAESDA